LTGGFSKKSAQRQVEFQKIEKFNKQLSEFAPIQRLRDCYFPEIYGIMRATT